MRLGGAGRRCRRSGWTWWAGWSPASSSLLASSLSTLSSSSSCTKHCTEYFYYHYYYHNYFHHAHPQRHAGGDGVLVQPEADPGHNHQHAARHVDGDQVVRELPLEDELHLQAAVFTCIILIFIIFIIIIMDNVDTTVSELICWSFPELKCLYCILLNTLVTCILVIGLK